MTDHVTAVEKQEQEDYPVLVREKNKGAERNKRRVNGRKQDRTEKCRRRCLPW